MKTNHSNFRSLDVKLGLVTKLIIMLGATLNHVYGQATNGTHIKENSSASILHPESAKYRDHIELPRASLITKLRIEINSVPGKMTLSQRVLFETKLEAFLQKKIDQSSSHAVRIIEASVTSETLSKEQDGLFFLLADVLVHGKPVQGSEIVVSKPMYEKYIEDAIDQYDKYLASDIQYLNDEDEYFQDILGIKVHGTIKNDESGSAISPTQEELSSSQGKQNYLENGDELHELKEFKAIKTTKVVAIIAITTGAVGLCFILTAVFYAFFWKKHSQDRIDCILRKSCHSDEVKTISSPRYSKKKKISAISDFSEIEENSFHGSEVRRSFRIFTKKNSPLAGLKKVFAPKRKEHHQVPQEEDAIQFHLENQMETGDAIANADDLFSAHSANSERSDDHDKYEKKVCFAPPGKLGVAIDTVGGFACVHKVKSGSPLEGKLTRLDRIVAINEVDTSNMNAAEITRLMVSKMNESRRIHYIRKGPRKK